MIKSTKLALLATACLTTACATDTTQKEAYLTNSAAPSAAIAASSVPFATRCAADYLTAPANTTFVSAKVIADPVPYCRIDGYVTTNNPGPNRVNFQISMPERHNGRYLFTIQGGAAAFVPEPGPENLKAGYAIASTDKGVRAAHILDFTFRDDPAQSRDWADRGVHVSAQASQQIVRQFYGRDQLFRYASGCSGGGDGTLSAAELHPKDFDAYIAAAMTVAPLEINHIWGAIAQHMYKNPDSWISPEEYQQIHDVLLREYDDADGAKDGLIWRPQEIELKRTAFPFLSDDQFNLLQFMQAGLTEEKGTFYPGFWLANVTAFPRFLTGVTRPPWESMDKYPAGFVVTDTGARGINGPDYNVLDELDYSNRDDLVADRKLQGEKGRHFFDAAKLQGLYESGGKLLLWSGMAEQAVPPGNILYYTKQAENIFGAQERQSFLRTFFVPGLHHCTGGENAPADVPEKMLEAAQRWVEQGEAPEYVVASNPQRDDSRTRVGLMDAGADLAPATRTYKLCSWPRQAVYREGDFKVADNWTCE